MLEYYGKNYPINYKSYYGFEEKWQNKDKKPSLTP